VFKVVLYQPEIAGNTGNIARTCAVTGCSLHLVRPLGFQTDEKHLKRAGLDYWDLLDINYYDSLEEVLERFKDSSAYFLTSKAPRCYADVHIPPGSLLVFGRETAGLPEWVHRQYADTCLRIPMLPVPHARCLNLSNSVAVTVFEAFRQNKFATLSADGSGSLHAE